jgi:WD40 repeat protein
MYKHVDGIVHVIFSEDSRHLLMDTKTRSLLVCAIEVHAPSDPSSAGPPQSVTLREAAISMRVKPPYATSNTEKLRLRPSFGGRQGSFVAMGTTSGKIHIWHWPRSHLSAALSGHEAAVNCLAWSPADQHLMISVSDDRTVRVWTSPDPDG